jgi:hypothetical protein
MNNRKDLSKDRSLSMMVWTTPSMVEGCVVV